MLRSLRTKTTDPLGRGFPFQLFFQTDAQNSNMNSYHFMAWNHVFNMLYSVYQIVVWWMVAIRFQDQALVFSFPICWILRSRFLCTTMMNGCNFFIKTKLSWNLCCLDAPPGWFQSCKDIVFSRMIYTETIPVLRLESSVPASLCPGTLPAISTFSSSNQHSHHPVTRL